MSLTISCVFLLAMVASAAAVFNINSAALAITADKCGTSALCDDDTFDPRTHCRKYGLCTPVGGSIFNGGCTHGCVCEQRGRGNAPAKWRCGDDDVLAICTDCKLDKPTGDCTDYVSYGACHLSCLCGVDEAMCNAEAPCTGFDVGMSPPHLDIIFSKHDKPQLMCDKCGSAACDSGCYGGADGIKKIFQGPAME